MSPSLCAVKLLAGPCDEPRGVLVRDFLVERETEVRQLECHVRPDAFGDDPVSRCIIASVFPALFPPVRIRGYVPNFVYRELPCGKQQTFMLFFNIRGAATFKNVI